MSISLVKDLDINPRITVAAVNGGFKVISKVLEANANDIRNVCRLNEDDVDILIDAAAAAGSPPIVSAYHLKQVAEKNSFLISTGCKLLDNFFGNGLPCLGITEIAGQSGTGKTQLGLQLALNVQLKISEGGIAKNVVYICTEGKFPVNRLQQLVRGMCERKSYNGKSFLDNIIVEHLPDMDQLRDWLSHRLEVGIEKCNIGCLIIDSIASVFRASESSQRDKSSALRIIGNELRRRTIQGRLSVIAINQVSAAIGGNHCGFVDNNIPALGLSWNNFVTTRIMINKTGFVLGSDESKESISSDVGVRVRSLDLIYNPWLPRKSCPFIVTATGVRGVDMSTECLKAEEIL